MITPFFRSSLLTTISLCELKGFIEYNIGIRGGASHASLIGSTVHGVFEIFALEKLAQQNNQLIFEHDSFGEWDTVKLPVTPTNALSVSFDYYDKESPGIFIDKDECYKECMDIVKQGLAFHGGSFDPRKSTIYAAELPFEIEMEDDWAEYSYKNKEGKVISGKLCLKGTIDLVLQENETTLICLDYKTGKLSADWATGKEKDDKSLYYDPQLMLYYYVLAHIFPDKDILMTLYFVRLDKAYTIVFDRNKDIPRIKLWIKERFKYIESIEEPTWIDGTKIGWKCKKCIFNTKKQLGTKMSICKYYQKQFATKSYDEIMKENADFKMLHNYGAGGSTASRK